MTKRIVTLCAGLLSLMACASRPPQITIEYVPTPRGVIGFCIRNPDICLDEGAGEYEPIPDVYNMVAVINRRTNMDYSPMTDKENYGEADYWAFPNGAADCEDYALEKRRRLIAAGVNPNDLFLAIVDLKGDKENHVVLIWRHGEREIVLDSNYNGLLPVWRTGYKLLYRQAIGGNFFDWAKYEGE